jgi:superkiller protein 3
MGIVIVVVIYLLATNGSRTPTASPGVAQTATAAAAQTTANATSPAFEQLTNEGLTLYNNKDYGRAEAAFRKAIEASPDNAVAYNNLGSALNDQKKFDEAIIVLSKAVELDPTLAIARNNLAYARSQKAAQ